MTATPTWTYTPQTLFRNAAVLDETGEVIAAVTREPEADEANEIAALMAAAPRLLIVAQMALAVAADTPRPEELIELWEAASEAYRAATEVSE
jgi:hypothetical protein